MGSSSLAAIGVPYIFILPIAAYAGTLTSTQSTTALGGWLGGVFSSSFTGPGLIAIFVGILIIAFVASTAATPGMGRMVLVAGGGIIFWSLLSLFALPLLLTWPVYGILVYSGLTLVELLGIAFSLGGGGI